MEEVNECLLIDGIEISCWKEQLKQVVSQSLTLIIFHAIQSISVSNPDYFDHNHLKLSYFTGICKDYSYSLIS